MQAADLLHKFDLQLVDNAAHDFLKPKPLTSMGLKSRTAPGRDQQEVWPRIIRLNPGFVATLKVALVKPRRDSSGLFHVPITERVLDDASILNKAAPYR